MCLKNMCDCVDWKVSSPLELTISDGTFTFSLVGKPTDQSSVYTYIYDPFNATSDRAVDGSINNIFSDGSCTHTLLEENPWWAVDMESLVTVFSVDITNRQDCCRK